MEIAIFILFYIFAAAADNSLINTKHDKDRKYFVFIACLVLAFISGLRSIYWPDTFTYKYSFENTTPTIDEFSFLKRPAGYSEKGYFLLASIIRTFTSNYQIYFICISLLTFYFLYRFINKNCIFPLIAVCVYIARFYIGRNFMQIRAGLAIPVVLMSLQYIEKKQFWKFLWTVFIAYYLHHSALIVFPFYFIQNYLTIKKKHIVWGIGIAYLITWTMGSEIRSWLQSIEYVNEMASAYVIEGNQKASGKGLENIMIYYQTILLFVFTFSEKRLAPLYKNYYVIRNAYFYCTVILIMLSSFAILSARLSTVFATLECIMYPSYIFTFVKKERVWAYIGIGVLLTAFLYLNLN